jgi:putative ABC transport system permease protein
MLHDLRYSLRTLRRSPGFTASAVLAIALAVGVNTAVFAVVYRVLLEPLPYPDGERLVRIWETNHPQSIERGEVSPTSVVEWRQRSRAFDRIAVYGAREWLIAFDEELEAVQGAFVSPDLFAMLGAAPVIGQPFPAEGRPGAEPAAGGDVLIGHGLWQRRFGGRPNVVGKTVSIEGRVSRTIRGVLPPGFDFPAGTQIWTSETFERAIGPNERSGRWRQAMGQLRAGGTAEEAERELNAIAAQLATEYPDTHAGWGVAVRSLHHATSETIRPALLVLFAAVGCVLLIAGANVANLMIARATARRHELAVRMALGAGRRRLVRGWLTEALVIAVMGSALGVVFGAWLTTLVTALAPVDVPRMDAVAVRAPVLLFVGAVTVGMALFTGLIAAWQAREVTVHHTLMRTGRTAAGAPNACVRGVLIGGQVALTLTLLVSAALLLRSFTELRRVDLGFEPQGVVTVDTRLPTGRFPLTAGRPWFRLAMYYETLLAELAALPGVQAVGGSIGLPLTENGAAGNVWMEERGRDGTLPPAEAQWTVTIDVVTPDYFRAMGMHIVRGRSFRVEDRLTEEQLTSSDDARPRGVAIVNEAFARRFLPGQEPIGRSLVLFDHWAVSASTIVGVVADVRQQGVALPSEPAVYVPFGEMPGFQLSIAVRSALPPTALVPAVAERLRHVDSRLAVSNLRPLTEVVGTAIAGPRFNLLLVGSFAGLALMLAAIGVYGVVGYLVAQRTRELGIRIALGARRDDVLRTVLMVGMRPVLLGAAVGVLGAVAASHVVRGLLFGVAPLDPVSFGSAVLLVLLVAWLAAALPALRATRVDPVVVLRDE